MSRFLFLTWDGAGNQPPVIGVGHALRERGHEVIFAGYKSQGTRLSERGFPFVLMERSDEAARRASSLDGWMQRLEAAVLLCEPQLEEVPELFARTRGDVLVADCMLFGALTAAEHAHLPTAVLVHSAPGALLAPDGAFGHAFVPSLNTMRADLGLSAVDQTWDAWRGTLVLCTSIRQLDPLADQVPDDFEYVGPVFEQVPPSGWRSPWLEDDDRPLVLVSFSTGPAVQGQRSRLERALPALASMPCRVLVTTSSAAVGELEIPENAVCVRHVPHGEILPQARVTVTHAGHGTTIASLAHGVPLVCLPKPVMPTDQLPLAGRVQELGVGRALDGDGATMGEIADAVWDLLTNPTYAARARELARSIRCMPVLRGQRSVWSNSQAACAPKPDVTCLLAGSRSGRARLGLLRLSPAQSPH